MSFFKNNKKKIQTNYIKKNLYQQKFIILYFIVHLIIFDNYFYIKDKFNINNENKLLRYP